MIFLQSDVQTTIFRKSAIKRTISLETFLENIVLGSIKQISVLVKKT
jgi:hypothetical protein